MARRRAVDRLARRWGRSAAKEGLRRALEQGLVHEWVEHRIAGGRARARTLLAHGPEGDRPGSPAELTGEELRRLLDRAHWTQSELGRRLGGIKQPQINAWAKGRERVPPARSSEVRAVLAAAAREWLLAARHAADLTQAQLAASIGVEQTTISAFERHPDAVSAERWMQLESALAEAQARAASGPFPPDPGPELALEELGRLLAAAPINQSELARRLGVRPPVVSSWCHGRKRIPPRRWQEIRRVLADAQPPPRRDRVLEEVLPAVLEVIRAHPGVLRERLHRALPTFGQDSIRSAVRLALERDELRTGPSVVSLPSGQRREYVGLYLAGQPVPEARDRVAGMLPTVLEAVAAAPGQSRQTIVRRLGGDVAVARAAVARAVELGIASERPIAISTDGRLIRRGLYPTDGHAPPSTDGRKGISPNALRSLGRRLGLDRHELAALLARELGVAAATATGWLARGVSAARAPAVLAALGHVPTADVEARERLVRERILAVVAFQPGVTQRELGRRIPAPLRLSVGPVLRALLDGDELHIAPVWDGPRSRLGLHPGPWPQESRRDLPPGELGELLARADLRPSEAANLLGVSRPTFSRWRNGVARVPPGYRAQVRALPALAAARRELEPEPLSGSELRALRARAGETQLGLARRLYVSQSTIRRWEASEVPADERQRVLNALAGPQATSAPPLSRWARELQQARKAAKLTQRELGQQLGGRSGGAVSAWETGRSDPGAELCAAARELLASSWPSTAGR